MDSQTQKIKEWLDQRFLMGVKEGEYFSHQPIYGYGIGKTEGRHLIRYATILSILDKLSKYKFKSFIDVGGAEGYTAQIVKNLFDVNVVSCDLSYEACVRARQIFGIDSAAVDVAALPFGDRSFDAVICSEVIEHLINPIPAILELYRIANRVLVITSEAICYDKIERMLRMKTVNAKYPHCDRNWFLADDFIDIFGEGIHYENTIYDRHLVSRIGYSNDEACDVLQRTLGTHSFSRKGLGISVVLVKEPSGCAEPSDPSIIINSLFSTKVDRNYQNNLAKAPSTLREATLSILRCTECNSLLNNTGNLICTNCRKEYRVVNGVPLLYPESADNSLSGSKRTNIYKQILLNRYDKAMQLEHLFKAHAKGHSFLPRVLIRRLLKINVFRNNCLDSIREKGISGLGLYLSHALMDRIMKEINRIIKRIRSSIVR